MKDISPAKEVILLSLFLSLTMLLLGIASWFFSYTLEFQTCNKQAKNIEEIKECEAEFPKTNWDSIWR